MIDLVAYLLVRSLVALLGFLPYQFSLRFVRVVTKAIFVFLPRYERIALRNLAIAFPDFSEAQRKQIYHDSQSSIARLLVDFARIHKLGPEWVHAHVECPLLKRYEEIKKQHPEGGVLLVTGHLGSFELLAHCMAVYGHPISFVVRNFKLPLVDRWWTARREANGNRVIARKGAFKEVISVLKQSRDVALLFDQNVTRNHAVFVEWFGRLAATTKTVGFAAVRTEAPVIVASIEHRGEDRYLINAVECDFTELYNDPLLSTDEKILKITARVSAEYVNMIRKNPGEWFWMHRRWKTTPEGVAEDVYTKGPSQSSIPA